MGGQESKIDHQKDWILSRKLEAMKRRRSSSLSKQMLLKDVLEDDGLSNDQKSSAVFPPEPQEDSVAESAKVAPIEPMVFDNGIDKEISVMGGKKERPISLICPRSPSFRLYLTEKEKQGHYSKGKEESSMVRESLSDIDVGVAKEIVESETFPEELGSKINNREKKGMRFRRILPPVKNFLITRSCYCPSCGDQKTNQLLLTQTPASL